jgi:hypothetical protein
MYLRTFWVVAVLCAAPAPVAAQSFTAVMAETSAAVPLGQEAAFNGSMTNTSTGPLTLALIRESSTMPAGWTSSLCFEACYPPGVDTVLTTPAWGSSPLQPGETRAFSLHVYPVDVHGEGIVRVLLQNTRNTADSIGFTLTTASLSTGAEMITPVLPGEVGVGIYPNPFNSSTTLELDLPVRSPVEAVVVDVCGREVARPADGVLEAGRTVLLLDGGGLASGVYFLRISAAGRVALRRLVLMK